jgi:hypothetical protein
MPEMRMNSLKSRAMNVGPLSEMMRGFASRYFSGDRGRDHRGCTASPPWKGGQKRCDNKFANPAIALPTACSQYLALARLRKGSYSERPQGFVSAWLISAKAFNRPRPVGHDGHDTNQAGELPESQ